MLVLTRKVGERIRIGDAVVVVVDIHGTRAKIGIEAPMEVKVLRQEVADMDKGEAA